MSRLHSERDREDLQKYILSSHESFEEKECLNCFFYCDGCTSDNCPGHAVQDTPNTYDEQSREEEAEAYRQRHAS